MSRRSDVQESKLRQSIVCSSCKSCNRRASNLFEGLLVTYQTFAQSKQLFLYTLHHRPRLRIAVVSSFISVSTSSNGCTPNVCHDSRFGMTCCICDVLAERACNLHLDGQLRVRQSTKILATSVIQVQIDDQDRIASIAFNG
jgi:hypothetical protein